MNEWETYFTRRGGRLHCCNGQSANFNKSRTLLLLRTYWLCLLQKRIINATRSEHIVGDQYHKIIIMAEVYTVNENILSNAFYRQLRLSGNDAKLQQSKDHGQVTTNTSCETQEFATAPPCSQSLLKNVINQSIKDYFIKGFIKQMNKRT